MNRIPAELDLTFFVGKTLEQVSFGEHQVQFRFADGVELSVESMYRITVTGRAQTFEDIRSGASSAVALIGLTVTEARAANDRTLHLEFGPRHALEVEVDSAEYESFQITGGPEVVVV